MELYHVWWPWLTSKCVARFVSDSWVSCFYFSVLNKHYVGNFRHLYVCWIDQTFGRKYSLVAHRHQNNLSIQSTWHSMTGSGHRVKKRPGRVGLGHGSKIQTRFHLWAGNMLLNCTYVAHALRRWLLTYQCKNKIKKGNCGLHLRDDFRKCAYLCTAKRGLCFSWSHCLCLHCFSRLKLHYADADTHTKKRIFICNFSYFWVAYTCLWFFRFCKTRLCHHISF